VNSNYLGTGFIFIYVGTILVFKMEEYVIGFIGQILRGCLSEIIYMNVDAPVENKCDDTKDII